MVIVVKNLQLSLTHFSILARSVLTGEVTLKMDSLVFMRDPRGFVAKLMVFVFMTFASLILVNLFMGILSEAWIFQLTSLGRSPTQF